MEKLNNSAVVVLKLWQLSEKTFGKITMNETPLKIIRMGLSLVFLANGLAAFIAPQEFKELVEASFVSRLLPLPIAVFLLFIGINDLSMSALILLAGKYQKYIFAWAMIWLVAVMVIVGEPLAVLEHVGFFAMALALWVSVVPSDGRQFNK